MPLSGGADRMALVNRPLLGLIVFIGGALFLFFVITGQPIALSIAAALSFMALTAYAFHATRPREDESPDED